MKDIFNKANQIFESSGSVFDKMDMLIALYEAAEDEKSDDTSDENAENKDSAVDDIDMDAAMDDSAEPVDPTQPQPDADQEAQPADEDSGVYISTNQKAVLAKTMLDALLAQPPQAGEIPEELLNVTDANADQVIKFIQSLTSLSSTLDTSVNSDLNPNSLASELKEIR